MWTGGQRSLTAQANFRPSIEPGIWKSVNTTRMSGLLSRMTIASSAFAASATSNPASLITCAAWIRIRNSSSTIRMTGRSVVECAKMCLSQLQLSHASPLASRRRNLQLQERHAFENLGVSFAVLRCTKDCLSDRLYMDRTQRVWKCCNCTSHGRRH
jgi:hypothetical protein